MLFEVGSGTPPPPFDQSNLRLRVKPRCSSDTTLWQCCLIQLCAPPLPPPMPAVPVCHTPQCSCLTRPSFVPTFRGSGSIAQSRGNPGFHPGPHRGLAFWSDHRSAHSTIDEVCMQKDLRETKRTGVMNWPGGGSIHAHKAVRATRE